MSFTIKRGAYSQPPNEESTHVNKRFANGDSYKGSWKHHRPDGEGRYNWENGSWYEGAWLNGKQHGVGKYVWPSGAIYQGEWRGGSMHGVGTLTSPGVRNNGYPNLAQTTSFALSSVAVPRYQGSWVADQRTGLGKQIYARGDMYEGLWRENQPEGPGRYMFISGEEYDGEWRGGLMSGQGTFVWSGGERYDGNWKNGKPDGLGILSMGDGTTYDSQWRAGKRHGVCVYITPELKNLRRGSIRRSSMLMTPPLPQGNQRQRKASILLPSLSPSASNNALLDPPTSPTQHHHQQQHLQQQRSRRLSSAPIDAWQAFPHHAKEHQAKAGSTFVRVYQNGNIVREWQVPKEEAGSILPHFAANRTGTGIGRLLRSKTGGNGEASSPVGEAINKGHQAYSIMLALQLGIRYSVTRVTPEPSFRQLDEYDFQQEVKQLFPRGGSEMTAVHSGEEFMWKDYAPMAFRKLREFFEIDAGSYMRSLCSDTALRLLNSPGKSGAVFLLSNDNQYFVKTVKPNEVALLCSMLPRYYHHVSNHPHTLLNKFFGLHRVSLKSGRKVHLVVMANLFNQMQLHQKFDIKGSRLGRTAGTAGMDAKQQAPMILKDLDLDMSFRLEDGWLDRLAYQLKSDCGLLEQCRIMDYSLLLGVHYRNRQTEGQAVSNFSDLCFDDEFNVNFPRLCDRVSKLRLPDDARKALLALLRARLSRNKQRAIDRQQQSVSASDALAMQQGNTRVQLGVNMPAKAMPRNMDRPPEDVVLYFGIIDILQDYNTSKMLEHNLKSLVHDSYSVSVIDPRTYSQRFQSFLMSIFS